MYMRNNSYNYNKYSKYNMDGLPPNYSGQYRNAPPDHYQNNQNNHGEKERDIKEEIREEKREERREEKKEEHEEPREKRGGSLLGNLFGGNKDREHDGKKGGLLSGFFNKGDKKDGGLFSHIEIEDLILIAVIFFLLKDGFEDDLILILAIILFST